MISLPLESEHSRKYVRETVGNRLRSASEYLIGHQGWSTKAASLPNGELLTVSATARRKCSTFAVPALSAYWRAARIISRIIWQWRKDHEHLGQTH
jgi:hypothetical protein